MSRKHYGLPNYLRFYNGEVMRFFDPTTESSSNLISLYISDDDTVEGVYWTAHEKNQFFHYLARHLIHQVEVIASNIPTKSVVQILAYYHLLKRELRDMKRHRVDVSIAKVPVRLHANQKAFIHKFKLQKKLKRLVLIKEMPIAYEVSERFIEMEEVQSLMLAETERRRNNDENQRFSAPFKLYKLLNPNSNQKKDQQKDRENDQRNDQRNDQQNDQQNGANEALIDLKIATEITSALCKKLNQQNETKNLGKSLQITLETRILPKLHFKGIMLLEMLVRAETKKIICQMMNDRINKSWLMDQEGTRIIDPVEFTRVDVENVLKQNFKNAKEVPVQKEDEGNINIEEMYEAPEEIENEQNNDNGEDEKVYEIEFLAPEQQDYIAEINGIVPVSQLTTNQPTIEEANHTALNSLIQDALHREEERALTKHDLIESQNHEHILLTALTTFREDSESVQESMLDIDEAFEILEEGDLDFADGIIDTDESDLEPKVVQVNQEMVDEFMSEFPTY